MSLHFFAIFLNYQQFFAIFRNFQTNRNPCRIPYSRTNESHEPLYQYHRFFRCFGLQQDGICSRADTSLFSFFGRPPWGAKRILDTFCRFFRRRGASGACLGEAFGTTKVLAVYTSIYKDDRNPEKQKISFRAHDFLQKSNCDACRRSSLPKPAKKSPNRGARGAHFSVVGAPKMSHPYKYLKENAFCKKI